jgi:hypothetical protein
MQTTSLGECLGPTEQDNIRYKKISTFLNTTAKKSQTTSVYVFQVLFLPLKVKRLYLLKTVPPTKLNWCDLEQFFIGIVFDKC